MNAPIMTTRPSKVASIEPGFEWPGFLPFILGLLLLLAPQACGASATPADVDRVLTAFQSYTYDADAAPLRAIEGLVREALAAPELRAHLETEMIRFLQAKATRPAKQFVCQQLWILGTDASIPALKQLLANDTTAEIACYALRSYPGAAANNALCQALPRLNLTNQVRIVTILGDRREASSLDTLLKVVALTDAAHLALAQAAASALGKIGGARAAQALDQARHAEAPELRRTATQAYLQCAEDFARRNQPQAARLIYLELMEIREANLTRRAALLGLMRLGGPSALDQVLSILQGTDPWLKATAIANSHLLPGDAVTEQLAQILPDLGPADQVLLMDALRQRGGPQVTRAVIPLADSTHPQVRAAALNALGTLGDADTIAPLLRGLAAWDHPEVVEASLRALRSIEGPGVGTAILAGLSECPLPARPALIQVIGDRQINNATPLLLEQTRLRRLDIRRAAFNVLGKLATPDHLPALLASMLHQPDADAASAAERAIVMVAQRLDDPQEQTRPVLAALKRGTDDERTCALLRVLGGIANNPALQALQDHLAHADPVVRLAAVRELANWPNPEALPSLETVWRNPDAPNVDRVLALRGYVRLLGHPSDRPSEQTVALFETVTPFVTTPEDKKLLLSSLSKQPSPGALRLAEAFLEAPSVREEAALAVVTVAGQLVQSDHQTDLAPALKKAMAVTTNTDLRQKAQRLLQQIQ